jgi:beta-phosphoglucomutase-like phosphatase (HAD superfamily)
MSTGEPRDVSLPFDGAWPELVPGPQVRALLFDCDGTLVDTMGLYEQGWRELLAPYGFEMSHEWFYAHAARSGREFVAAAVPSIDDAEAARLEREVIAMFHTRLHELETFDHVVDVARHYRGVLPLVVVSGGAREAVESTLVAVGIRDLFDDVITVTDVAAGKPEPDGYLLALERLGLEPHEALAYEDSTFGMDAARAAGIPVVDVRTHPYPQT